jgi:predicted nucleic acid-binding protein
MDILIDTNIAIDVIMQRDPFFKQSQLILLLAEEKIINGYISATSVTDIFYITSKLMKNKDLAKERLKNLLFESVEVAAVDGTIITQAMNDDWDDFEDCVQYYVGESISADYIVTRNPDDFTDGSIKILTPEQLLDLIAPE